MTLGTRRVPDIKMFKEGDIGVLPPLGVYDPLGLIGSRDMRRYEARSTPHSFSEILFTHA